LFFSSSSTESQIQNVTLSQIEKFFTKLYEEHNIFIDISTSFPTVIGFDYESFKSKIMNIVSPNDTVLLDYQNDFVIVNINGNIIKFGATQIQDPIEPLSMSHLNIGIITSKKEFEHTKKYFQYHKANLFLVEDISDLVVYDIKYLLMPLDKEQYLKFARENNIHTMFLSRVTTKDFSYVAMPLLPTKVMELLKYLDEYANDKAKVLIIEDNPTIRWVLTQYLQKQDFIVHTANNGQDGLDMFRRDNFNLIFVDVTLPIVDGYETIEQIISIMQKSKKVPIIALTDTQQTVSGVDGYLQKPIDEGELNLLLNTILQKQIHVIINTKKLFKMVFIKKVLALFDVYNITYYYNSSNIRLNNRYRNIIVSDEEIEFDQIVDITDVFEGSRTLVKII